MTLVKEKNNGIISDFVENLTLSEQEDTNIMPGIRGEAPPAPLVLLL